ncbi:MAG: macro domain-containing protein [Campylobacteraceae bacterium]|jgi:O-acetyl-ADP-ribose deacetylase (regulator of RNase III)|nr:macro domain-containing protein [Campylobacteraceae bacterium]
MSLNPFFVRGDVLSPVGEGDKIITHICNDIGGWGAGFVLSLSKKWTKPQEAYMEWFRSKDGFALGEVQFVKVQNDIVVANMIAQRNIRPSNGVPPIRYDALEICLAKTADFALENSSSVHMPRIGCGLAGGEWEKVENVIRQTLLKVGISVFVYDLR